MAEPQDKEIIRLATLAYEQHGGGTDEGLITFLLQDIVDQQKYVTYRQSSGRGHLSHTHAVEKRIAMEAAIIERLRQQ